VKRFWLAARVQQVDPHMERSRRLIVHAALDELANVGYRVLEAGRPRLRRPRARQQRLLFSVTLARCVPSYQ